MPSEWPPSLVHLHRYAPLSAGASGTDLARDPTTVLGDVRQLVSTCPDIATPGTGGDDHMRLVLVIRGQD